MQYTAPRHPRYLWTFHVESQTPPIRTLHAALTKILSVELDAIYPAPAPSELKTIQYLPKLGSGTPTYATVTATASEASGETSSEESEADISSDGISAGEAAGIGVGVGMGIILIAALAFVLFFRKRATKIERRISPFDSDSPGQPEYSQQVYELDKNQAPTPELDITP
ncbi:hypothetical protein EYZ11_004974 [Aspergillus tanneri]|uniref:Mid2 domain-containing protein n=1 Tax=Aspergillus tanneri TaxID=1220188 RepID=A0A4S3JJ35_9EURO|nr:hypothetical protein EYZ11_004974 [Aspergillus tanneri]